MRRDGYTFDGWYTKEKGGKKYSASTIIKKSLNFTHVGLKNTKLILIILFLWD
ncbi:InlB B-repeat-containing protein [Eubacterium ventriosum]|uniref:InlB B-repeat-containing protein n=1 Tax=Eubacterium ventriosum TaxID=39496 RepID=UPI0039927A3C